MVCRICALRNLATLTLMCAIFSATTHGQSGDSRWFAVKGAVVDQDGRPLAASVVHLQDTAGQVLRMKHAERDGRFHFSWLEADREYELYAENGRGASERVRVSGHGEQAREVILKIRTQAK
jgi:hypothetical protein